MVQFHLRCPHGMHFQSRLPHLVLSVRIWVHRNVPVSNSFAKWRAVPLLPDINKTAGASEGLKSFSEDGSSGFNFEKE